MEEGAAPAGAELRFNRIETLKHRANSRVVEAFGNNLGSFEVHEGRFRPTVEPKDLGEKKGQESSGSVGRSFGRRSVGH